MSYDEFALKPDCEAQGCDPPHEDRDEVMWVTRHLGQVWSPEHGTLVVNRHKTRLFKRTIGDWTEVQI